uniref:RRM domain-containing protein n=1 Tax=Bombyx mori TaxID=7091 RepID=A0A8R2C6M5_BOMMO|nr:uncharacterized protein LOC101744180 [Bombyx mori]
MEINIENIKNESSKLSSNLENVHNRVTPNIIIEDKLQIDTTLVSEKIKNDLYLNLEEMDTETLKETTLKTQDDQKEKFKNEHTESSIHKEINETVQSGNRDYTNRPLKRYRNRVSRRWKRLRKDIPGAKNTADFKRAKENTFYDSSSDESSEEYSLTVSKIPSTWTYLEIKNYIQKECGPVEDLTLLKDQGGHGSIRLTYQDEKDCKYAMEILQNKIIEGNKLEVVMEVSSISDPTSETENRMSWINSLDLWENDEEGLYGLKPEFLKFLGITPPIDKWVHVTNFRCDKTELRDVMELAGQVLICSVVTIANRYAKVMYSHPLEAVQAVSMLNGQMLYGNPLNVKIERNPTDTVTLPKGLAAVGLGLGKRGVPLRNIVQHYERFINNKSSMINPSILSGPDLILAENSNDVGVISTNNNDSNRTLNHTACGQNTMASFPRFTVPNPLNQTGQSRATVAQNIRPHQPIIPKPPQIPSNMGQEMKLNSGPQMNTGFVNGPISAQNHIRPMVWPQFGDSPSTSGTLPPRQQMMPRPHIAPGALRGPGQMIRPMLAPTDPRPRPVMPQMPPRPISATVQLNNLPSSITMPMLCEKLSQSGEILSLQFTAPGCAVVRFANPPQAERCFHQLNRTQVSGHVLDVRIV